MKTITITLDNDVAHWAKSKAARSGTSLSSLISEVLRQEMPDGPEYNQAMKRFFSAQPAPLKTDGTYPSKDEVHERSEKN